MKCKNTRRYIDQANKDDEDPGGWMSDWEGTINQLLEKEWCGCEICMSEIEYWKEFKESGND